MAAYPLPSLLRGAQSALADVVSSSPARPQRGEVGVIQFGDKRVSRLGDRGSAGSTKVQMGTRRSVAQAQGRAKGPLPSGLRFRLARSARRGPCSLPATQGRLARGLCGPPDLPADRTSWPAAPSPAGSGDSRNATWQQSPPRPLTSLREPKPSARAHGDSVRGRETPAAATAVSDQLTQPTLPLVSGVTEGARPHPSEPPLPRAQRGRARVPALGKGSRAPRAANRSVDVGCRKRRSLASPPLVPLTVDPSPDAFKTGRGASTPVMPSDNARGLRGWDGGGHCPSLRASRAPGPGKQGGQPAPRPAATPPPHSAWLRLHCELRDHPADVETGQRGEVVSCCRKRMVNGTAGAGPPPEGPRPAGRRGTASWAAGRRPPRLVSCQMVSGAIWVSVIL